MGTLQNKCYVVIFFSTEALEERKAVLKFEIKLRLLGNSKQTDNIPFIT